MTTAGDSQSRIGTSGMRTQQQLGMLKPEGLGTRAKSWVRQFRQILWLHGSGLTGCWLEAQKWHWVSKGIMGSCEGWGVPSVSVNDEDEDESDILCEWLNLELRAGR